jgi:hypothetical protein
MEHLIRQVYYYPNKPWVDSVTKLGNDHQVIETD